MSLLRPHPERPSYWAGALILSSALHAGAVVYMLDVIPFQGSSDPISIAFPEVAISNIVLEQQELAALDAPPDTLAPVDATTSDPEPDAAETPEAERLEPVTPDEPEPVAAAEPETLAPVEPDTPEAEALTPVAPESPDATETVSPVMPDIPEAIAVAPVAPTNQRLTPVLPDEGRTVQGAVVQPVAPSAPVVSAVQTVTRVAPVAPPPRPRPTPPPQPAAAPPPSPEDLAVLELIQRIRNRFGDTCLIALPQNQGPGNPPLVTLVSDQDRTMATFVTDVLSDPNLPVDNRQVLVDPRQCPALDFARERSNYPTFRIDLGLQNRLIPSGERLSGRIGNVAGRYTSLLLVDSNGVVQDLRRFTRFTQGAAEFDLPVTVSGAQRDTSQLLIAIATPGRPTTVTQLAGRRAENFFAPLAAEIGDQAIIAILPFDVR